MKVMKFGGSSLADAGLMRRVAGIIIAQREKPVVVLSAMRGVTDLLSDAADRAERGDRTYLEDLQRMQARHERVAEKLLAGDPVLEQVREMLADLKSLLHGVELVRECSLRSRDLILSFGERLSCALVAAILRREGREATMVDARAVIVTDDRHGNASVLPESRNRIKKAVRSAAGIPVITGFIAANTEGVTTTLGRNGSDYTAALIGAAVRATVVEIWTDVDGVMSADPRAVAEAFVISGMSFQEAMELAYFGAKVLHPYTMLPAVEADIPLRIRNTLNSEAAGTLITSGTVDRPNAVTGLASIDQVGLINVEGGGMLGIPGFAARVFGALGRERVNVIMISQASSEHSICLVMREAEIAKAALALTDELAAEIASGRVQEPEVVRELAVVAIIGERMRGTPGISGKLFGALGSAAINVLAIAQGSSERNISIVVDRADEVGALRAIHKAFLEGEAE
jgi:aspartokinase/homoserine dehydrogenase 1